MVSRKHMLQHCGLVSWCCRMPERNGEADISLTNVQYNATNQAELHVRRILAAGCTTLIPIEAPRSSLHRPLWLHIAAHLS